MVEKLLSEAQRRGVEIREGLQAVSLLVSQDGRAAGALFLDHTRLKDDPAFGLTVVLAEKTVFGTGGPAGLYAASVYPRSQYGAIGLAIEKGAWCANLTESQFGLASVKIRWNLSGTYQQAIPRYYSVGEDGIEMDFLSPAFGEPGDRDSAVFLKGYQWPFDPRKVENKGSSLVDLLVYREIHHFGRKVFLDFRRNPQGWDPDSLSEEARSYLANSGALAQNSGSTEPAGSAESARPISGPSSPLERLMAMNPPAYAFYLDHGIDLAREPLQIAVAAQHNNGGLEGDIWWESTNIENLFPVGEVNGSHGVYRPGGSALNSGQVGAIRAARKIVASLNDCKTDGKADGTVQAEVLAMAEKEAARILYMIRNALKTTPEGKDRPSPEAYLAVLHDRMDSAAGILREQGAARRAAEKGLAQFKEFDALGVSGRKAIPALLRCRHLALAHAAYLETVASYLEEGGGSRGSYIVPKAPLEGDPADRFAGILDSRHEDLRLRNFIQRCRYDGEKFIIQWEARRPLPGPEDLGSWFETVWKDWREGRAFSTRIISSKLSRNPA
jgi:succinate dehydrogenase/fumarate reductase flavoprotein subunit